MSEKHIIRRANKEEAKQDCCGDRYECNVEYVCSCGYKGCVSCAKEHIFDLHYGKDRHLGGDMREREYITQFPHCDQRVLHAPGECEYCDAHPDWQELREAWCINFTGNHITNDTYNRKYLPCPSEVARPLDLINQWDGNVPFKNGEINDKAPMFEGKTIFHDPFSRHVEVVAGDEKKGLVRRIRDFLEYLDTL